MSKFDLRTAEDIEMRANAQFERWREQYESDWQGGEIMGQLSDMNKMIDPETRKIMQAMIPDQMAAFEALFDPRKAMELKRKKAQQEVSNA